MILVVTASTVLVFGASRDPAAGGLSREVRGTRNLKPDLRWLYGASGSQRAPYDPEDRACARPNLGAFVRGVPFVTI